MADFRDIADVMLKTQSPNQRGASGFQGFVQTLNESINALAKQKADEQLAKELADARRFEQMRKLAETQNEIAVTMQKTGASERQLRAGDKPGLRDEVRAEMAGIRDVVAGEPFVGAPNELPRIPTPQGLSLPSPELSAPNDVSLGVQAPELTSPQIPTEEIRTGVKLPEIKPTASTSGLTFEQRMALKKTGNVTDEQIKAMAKSVNENPALIAQISGATLVRVNDEIRKMTQEAPMSGSQAKQRADILQKSSAATSVIENLQKSLDRVELSKSALGRVTTGLGNEFEAWLQTNPDATLYNSQKTAFIGNLRNAMGGEVGVMTEDDAKRFIPFIPSLTDTQEVADFKFEQMRNVLQDIITEKMSAQTGSSVRGGEKEKPADTEPASTEKTVTIKKGGALEKLLKSRKGK